MEHGCPKKLVKSKSGLKFETLDGSRSPFLLEEPKWIADDQVLNCTTCKRKFDALHRRHHCRRCGSVFCAKCTSSKVPLPRMSFVDPVRHCASCSLESMSESDFFDKHLASLKMGGNFLARNDLPGEEEFAAFVRLSNCIGELSFSGHVGPCRDAVPIASVSLFQLLSPLANDFPSPASTTPPPLYSQARLSFTVANCQQQTLLLRVAEYPNREQSMRWLVAFDQAVEMLRDS